MSGQVPETDSAILSRIREEVVSNGITTVTPPPEPVIEIAPSPDVSYQAPYQSIEDGTPTSVTALIKRLASQRQNSVKITIKKKPLDGFGSYSIKDARNVDVESFVYEELVLAVGTKHGPGEYQFIFQFESESGQPFTRTITERIDLLPEVVPVQGVDRTPPAPAIDLERILIQVSQIQSAGLEKLATILAPKEDSTSKMILPLLLKMIEQQGAKPASTSESSPAELMASVVDAVSRMQEMTRGNIPIPPIQAAPPGIDKMVETFRLGIDTAKEAMELAGYGGNKEAGEDKPGLSGILERMGTGLLGGLMEKVVGGGGAQVAQQALPAPQASQEEANPAIQYVRYVLNGIPKLVASGYQQEHLAQYLRQNLTPQQLAILVNNPIVNITTGMPELAQYTAHISAAIGIIQSQVKSTQAPSPRRPTVQPQPKPDVVVESAPAPTPPTSKPKARRQPVVDIGKIVEESGLGEDGLPDLKFK